jgi:hypothetical protein
MLRSLVWQLVQGQSGGKPWIRIDNNNIGIENTDGSDALSGRVA